MSDQDEADVHDSQDNDSAESRPSNSTFWFNMDKPDLDEADFQMCIFWLATGAPLFGGYATTFLILHVEAIRAYGPGWLYLYGIIASSIPVLIGWILVDKCSNILIRRFGVMLGNGAFNCMCLLFFVGPCFLLAMIVGIFLGGGDGQLFTITVVVMCLVGVFWLIVQPRGLLAYVSSVASYLGTCLLLLLAIFLGNRTSVSDAYH